MATIEFGLALDFGTERARLDRVLENYLPLLRLAESYGFRSLWAGESYAAGPGAFHLPSPLLVLAALARSTRLRLGTGVTLLPAWHPLKLASDAAVLDQLSGGRLVLGVGAGNPALWTRFGVEERTVGDRLDETLAALRALWSGASGYRGNLVQVEGGIAPLPAQAGGPPIWVGGLAPRAARRAALFGDGWYASTQYRLGEIRQQIERYRRALAAASKDPARPIVAMNRLAVLAEQPEEAWLSGGPYVRAILRKYVALGALSGAEDLLGPNDGELEPLRRVCDGICLIGSPQTVVAELERYAAVGVTHVQLRVAPADIPVELAARTIRLAGEQVLPHFQEA